MKHFLGFTFLVLGIGTQLMAGGWSGNGGDLIEDAHNPWFIRHISKSPIVKYCILQSKEHFSVPLEETRSLVQSAFHYWRNEFGAADFFEHQEYGKLLVGAEYFIETTCDSSNLDSIPLRFQFGTLTETQLKNFAELGRDPTRTAGIAIREEYNRNTLEGRGFIYIAADSGPLELKGENIVKNVWHINYKERLELILRHEIGHVFGIPHMGDHSHLMGTSYPERLVSEPESVRFNPSHIFRKKTGWSSGLSCNLNKNEKLKPFLGLRDEEVCLQYQFTGKKIEVRTSHFNDIQRVYPIGEIMVTQITSKELPIVRLWIPPSSDSSEFNLLSKKSKVLTLASTYHYHFSGIFRNSSDEEKTVLMEIAPDVFNLSGIINKTLELNLFSDF